MKRPHTILIVFFGAILVLILIVLANISRSRSVVSGIEVSVHYGKVPPLVNSQWVKDSILSAIPTLLAMKVQDVDRQVVAEAASRVPYLRDVSATVSVSGKVIVRATQRRPIARLFYHSHEYYFDADEVFMPTSTQGSCDVLVAGGHFSEPFRPDSLNAQLQSLVVLARWLDEHPKYAALIDQIYAESSGDIVMVPKLGSHVVELGAVDNLEAKFANLWLFYLKGMPRAGWNTYSKISLKFAHQVVCTKKNQNR